ncbi:MAG: vWA domain-containing protein [Candidatus Binatus sp.]|jgi:hypothetical protein|uniref:hypothetical protein n=1 Tax=Candidatus Binatus sp. TaxID=2811406 RepID=UPI003C8045D0
MRALAKLLFLALIGLTLTVAAADRPPAFASPSIASGPFRQFTDLMRRDGLDVVLVIDDSGGEPLFLRELHPKIVQLTDLLHGLVPNARLGIVAFGDCNKEYIQPLTASSRELNDFLNGPDEHVCGCGCEASAGLDACETAINKMNWKPQARKVVVFIGDSPPGADQFGPLTRLISKFRGEHGTFSTIDVAPREHERFERLFWLKVHHQEPPKISPLPEYYQSTVGAYKKLAESGAGTAIILTKDTDINQQILTLAFGIQWKAETSAFADKFSSGTTPGK